MIPTLRRDPGYLTREDLEFVGRDGKVSTEVSDVTWLPRSSASFGCDSAQDRRTRSAASSSYYRTPWTSTYTVHPSRRCSSVRAATSAMAASASPARWLLLGSCFPTRWSGPRRG